MHPAQLKNSMINREWFPAQCMVLINSQGTVLTKKNASKNNITLIMLYSFFVSFDFDFNPLTHI